MTNIIPFKFQKRYSVVINGGSFWLSTYLDRDDCKIEISEFDAEKSKNANSKTFVAGKGLTQKVEKWIYQLAHKTSDTKGYIYLVSDGLYTKIGATQYNVKKRLNELQVGNVKVLKSLGSYKVQKKLSAEKYLHKAFKHCHVRGEWFDLSQKDISEILTFKHTDPQQNKDSYISPEEKMELEKTLETILSEKASFLQKTEIRRFNNLHRELYGDSGIFWKLNPYERKNFQDIYSNKAA